MSKLLRFTAVAVALVSLSGIVCKKNSAPEAPQIQGPTLAKPGAAMTYGFTSTDPDGDSVAYMVSWGDGTPTAWSPSRASGELYTVSHTYSDSGTYFITAKAEDNHDAVSVPSDSVQVAVGFVPPNTPERPQGPTRCTTGVAYTYTTRALDRLGDSVSLQFSWGDTIGDFGPLAASNEVYSASHTFKTRGSYEIAARARDARGLLSAWSESLAVTVDTAHHRLRGAPDSLKLTAATDSTVHLAWSAPTDSTTPHRYVVIFTETGSTHSDSVGGTDSLGFVHDPVHRTGRYQVAAVYDSGRVTSTEAPSTAPITNTFQSVPELSVPGVNTGYGWDRMTGQAELHDMTNADTASVVDFYVSDFAPGYSGPNYDIASPFLAPQDPGGGSLIPHSNYWHLNTFAYLDSSATENDPLPRYLQSRYRDSTVLDSFPILAACHTEDGYFALINASSIDTTSGTADIETWFQLIPNLRLIEH